MRFWVKKMQGNGCNTSEMVKFTLSLIVVSLSVNLMFIVDRTVLASFSVDAMNASSLGGNFVAMVSFVMSSIAQIATVFVGQYNGLKEYEKTAHAPWQMIYLGLISFLIYIPIAMFSDHLCKFPEELKDDGLAYVRILLYFGGFHVISVALSSFFIGLKRISLIIWTFVIGNVLNAVLDVALVFGIDGIIEPMGVRGAAVATIIIEFLFVIAFGIGFFSRHNREKYHTLDAKFRPKIFFDCIKIGSPASIAKFFNLLGWFAIMTFFTNASKDLATLESCIMGMWMAFIFIADGSSKALSALAANLIGRKQLEEIKILLKKYLALNYVSCAIYAIPLVLFPEIIMYILNRINTDMGNLSAGDIRFAMAALFIIVLMDGIFYMVCGVLTAGGDTKFPMYLDIATLWGIAVIPIAFMYYSGNLVSIRPPYVLIPLTGVVNAAVIYWRYKQFKWYRQIVDTE